MLQVRILPPDDNDTVMGIDREFVQKMAADAVLQTPFVVKIGGKEYTVAPPCLATLIRVSEMVSTMRFKMDDKDILNDVLRYARDCRVIGDIVAVLVLGVNVGMEKRRVLKKRWFGLVSREEEVEVNRRDELSKAVLEEMSPKEVRILLAQLLAEEQVSDFFGLTASLAEINLLKTEDETVRKKTTVSGQ